MSVVVKGVVEKQSFGPGTWVLVSETGVTYELKDPPPGVKQAGLRVEIEGTIREDVMSFAMIGPLLEISHFVVDGG